MRWKEITLVEVGVKCVVHPVNGCNRRSKQRCRREEMKGMARTRPVFGERRNEERENIVNGPESAYKVP